MSLYLEIWKVAIEFLVAVSPAIVGWPMMRRANSGLSFFFGAVLTLIGLVNEFAFMWWLFDKWMPM